MSDVFTSILQREGMGKNITISVARAGHYPTLDLVALYSAQKGVGAAITGIGMDITTKEIGLQFAVPVFQGGAVQSRVREALANQERVLQNLNNARRNSAMQVSQQWHRPGEGTETSTHIHTKSARLDHTRQ